MELFGSIKIGLAMVLQASVHVYKYLYVDPNIITQKVSMEHLGMLLDQYLELLPYIVVYEYLGASL